jgi:hypothetical protein
VTQFAKNFGSAEWDEVRTRFLERQSARQLAEAPDEAASDTALITAAKRALAGEISPHDLLKASGAALPIGLASVAKALLARRSIAFSAAARAASTQAFGPREVGPYLVEFAEEPDAIFLMVSCRSLSAPKLFQALTDAGLFIEIELPAPVEDVVQIGIARTDRRFANLLAVLGDSGSSFFLA